MLTFFQEGGIFMWPLTAIVLIIIYLSVRVAIELFSTDSPNPEKMKLSINTILFWGATSVVLGIFAHFTGVYLAMEAIRRAHDISPAIVAQGYAMSLITVLTGLFIFLISSMIWLALRWKYKKLLKMI
ncbi:MAG: MotA/TolQ/ExbB proton channel family protein [Calditrichaceae bacterium]|jgi:biopolymer transport protein ExbB/TolQ